MAVIATFYEIRHKPELAWSKRIEKAGDPPPQAEAGASGREVVPVPVSMSGSHVWVPATKAPKERGKNGSWPTCEAPSWASGGLGTRIDASRSRRSSLAVNGDQRCSGSVAW